MLWFRHNNDMRHRPEMKSIATRLGAHGVAAAYRLLEVWCDHCGSGENFNPTMTLGGPRNLQWLADEILLPDETCDEETACTEVGYGDNDQILRETLAQRSAERLQRYLDVFELCGLIEQGTVTQNGWRVENGKRITGQLEFKTITLLAADGILDSFTSRYKGKGAGQGKGYRSDRT